MFPDAQSPRPMAPPSRPVPGPPVPGPPAHAAVPGSPVPVPGPPVQHSGDEAVVGRVAEAVAGLAGLGELAVSEHVGRFDAVHAALTSALSSIDRV